MRLSAFHTASDGTQIWYGIQGQGPTLVLCDGIGCDGYVWPYVMDRFDESFTVVRWHYRGHGRSKEPDDKANLSIPHLAEDLRGILTELRDAGHIDMPAVLGGHSMGCQVILEYAHRYPEDCRALIPICGSYGRPLDTFQQTDPTKPNTTVRAVLEGFIRAVEMNPGLVDAVWKRGFSSRFSWTLAARTELNPDLIKRADFMPYLKHMGRIKAATFLRMLSHAAGHTAERFLQDLDLPVLVVAGRYDRFTPMRLSEEMVEMLPQGELVVLPDGTHTAPLEQPELLCDAIESFFLAHDLGQ